MRNESDTRVQWQTDAEKAAEAGLVGCALRLPELVRDADVAPEHFFSPHWARAWRAIQDLLSDGCEVTEETVAARAGGEDLYSRLVEASLQGTSATALAPVVRDAWARRQVLLAAGKVQHAAAQGLTGPELVSYALEQVGGIHVEEQRQSQTIGQLAKQRWLELAKIAEERDKGSRIATGIPTGIEGLDRLLGGLQRGIPTVAAGRPGMGKSAFAMTVADNATQLAGVGVHVFVLEDTESSYADRAIARQSGVAAESIRACDFQRGDLSRLRDGADRLHNRHRWLVDGRSSVTADEVVRAVRRDRERNGTEVVIVDYVQLLRPPPGFPRELRHNETAVIGHSMDVLANAAKRDNMAYLVLAQLNRDCEKRENKRPMLSDLKQSGKLEERAKTVLMLYRPSVYERNEPEDLLEIIVRKNSHGRTGTATATWDGPTTSVR